MARRNALVRRMPAVETLGCVSVICTDKTGTLTRGEMTARRVVAGTRSYAVGGAGYAPNGRIEAPEIDAGLALLLQAGMLCNDASVIEEAPGRWCVIGDPTEGALAVLATKGGLAVDATRMACERVGEIPFSSERMRMTTLHAMPDGRRLAFMKGAAECVLARCGQIREGSTDRALDAATRAGLHAISDAMAADALRVMAIACREVEPDGPCGDDDLERDMVFLGYVGLMDPPRPEAAAAVATCRQVGIRPVMITGDHKLTALAVAREIGIHREGDRVLDGAELAAMDVHALAHIVEQVSVYARVSPMDKLKIVRAWKQRGHVVAMTGDGVNDAPALKHADIGVAMGLAGTDVARESADIVLADDNFATIVVAIERGRWIYDNIKKYLTYLLRTNITEVIVLGGVVMAMGPQFLPMLPAAILYVNLASDGLPALALGVAPPDRDIMQRPPRDPKESVFSFDVRALIALAVLIECPIFLATFLLRIDEPELARTQVFLLFVVVELMLAMNFRSLRESLFEAPPHRWLLLAIGWELALLAVLMQFESVRAAFGIRMPGWQDLAYVLAVALGVMAVMELAKAALRRREFSRHKAAKLQ
ncbi:MAG TPA: cation-translocating P-type ATPase, partial [Usitatibacteraceae bacterium]|nr:cation-translocating P-type ATPase [Usitatibacteraceae bacterium]